MRLTFFENVTHNIVKGRTVYIKMIAVDPSHLGNIYHDSQKNDLKLKWLVLKRGAFPQMIFWTLLTF